MWGIFVVCKNILIVEDEEIIRDNLKALLELEGYFVCPASNGEEGLKILGFMSRPCFASESGEYERN